MTVNLKIMNNSIFLNIYLLNPILSSGIYPFNLIYSQNENKIYFFTHFTGFTAVSLR